MLLFFGNSEVVKDQEEDKKIVDAERQFEDVTGNKFETGLVSLPEKKEGRETGGHHHVHCAPAQRFTKSNNATWTVEDPEVDHQHTQCEEVEKNPEAEQAVSLAAFL